MPVRHETWRLAITDGLSKHACTSIRRLVGALPVALVFTSAAHAAKPAKPGDVAECAAFAIEAEQQQVDVRPVLGLRVIGNGRLPLHTAPDRRCPGKSFIIPGDRAIAYGARGKWYSVQYTNPKSEKIFEGWVPLDRVEVTGTMGCCATP